MKPYHACAKRLQAIFWPPRNRRTFCYSRCVSKDKPFVRCSCRVHCPSLPARGLYLVNVHVYTCHGSPCHFLTINLVYLFMGHDVAGAAAAAAVAAAAPPPTAVFSWSWTRGDLSLDTSSSGRLSGSATEGCQRCSGMCHTGGGVGERRKVGAQAVLLNHWHTNRNTKSLGCGSRRGASAMCGRSCCAGPCAT